MEKKKLQVIENLSAFKKAALFFLCAALLVVSISMINSPIDEIKNATKCKFCGSPAKLLIRSSLFSLCARKFGFCQEQ